MVSRVAPGKLPDPKASQNEAPDIDFLLFEDLAFTFFGDTLKYFVCSMNDNLIILDVNLLFSLLRLGGKTYGGSLLYDCSSNDSSSMIPLRVGMEFPKKH